MDQISGIAPAINSATHTTSKIAGPVVNAVTPPAPSTAEISPITAELTGSKRASALGFMVRSPSPVLALCRALVEAGHDPATPLRAYRGNTLALKVRSIGEGAKHTVEDNHLGKPVFCRWRYRAETDGAAPPVTRMAAKHPVPPLRSRHRGARARQQTRGAVSLPRVRSIGTKPLRVERVTTADMPTGEPQPPADDHNVVWQVAHRADGETLWRIIFLSPAAVWRATAGTSAKSADRERRE